jgi:lysophospholipase L1-like esterase
MAKGSRSYGVLVLFFAALVGSLAPGRTALAAGQCIPRIMPLGDSITRGVAGSTDNAGYRDDLYSGLLGLGYTFDFVGPRQDGSFEDPEHLGIGGIKADQVTATIYADLLAHPADLVLLHIGTNDISVNQQNPARIAKILDQIDRYATGVDVELARIINRVPSSTATTEYNRQVADMAADRIGDLVTLVDHEPLLDYVTDLYDDIHPNDLGYAKMADGWLGPLAVALDGLCSGAPTIRSMPVIWASAGDTYHYPVHALGAAPLTYGLAAAPSGMFIDSDTGVITWDPQDIGAFEVSVEVSNPQGTVDQSFAIYATERILDDGQPGTSLTGTWSASSNPNPYDGDSLSTKSVGAQYRYQIPVIDGNHGVYLWWTASSKRVTSVPVDIYDGEPIAANLKATVSVNQQQNGGQWNLLGSYPFANDFGTVVIRSTSSTNSTCADAVRVVAQDIAVRPTITSDPGGTAYPGEPYAYDVETVGTPAPSFDLTEAPSGMTIDPASGLIQWTPDHLPETLHDHDITVTASNVRGTATQDYVLRVKPLVIENGSANTSFTGTWLLSGGPNPHGSGSVFNKTSGKYYDFDAKIAAGPHQVWLWWTQSAGRGKSVPIEIRGNAGLIATVKVDQTINGGQFNYLGNFSFPAGTAKVRVKTPGNAKGASADAVMLVATPP